MSLKNIIKEDQHGFFRSQTGFGGSKDAEYKRSIEMLKNISKEKDIYYLLAFLYDSQYDREDIKKMMDLSKP